MVKQFTFSVCNFPSEFTCDSGTCVDIFKRCNNRKDCDDGSDEDNCTMLRLSHSYDKSTPPELPDDVEESNDIHASVQIINIDFIDTVNMVVGLTIDLTLKWKDYNINFENIKDHKNEENANKMIPEKDRVDIWVPVSKIVHDNAILGNTKYEEFYSLEVEVTNPAELMNPEEPRETLIYPGKENLLVMTQRMKLNYHCEFFLANFPFDDSSCDFIFSLVTVGNTSIRLTNNDDSVVYHGPLVLNEFEIIGHRSDSFHTEKKTSFIYTLHFQRLYTHHIMTTFFQSFLLWLLSYITLFIDIADFSNRFMGAVTSLLVLAALLSSIGENLPKTAYFKYIDLWFNWFIFNIFMIILIHVLVDFYHKLQTNIYPNSGVNDSLGLYSKPRNRSQTLNTACKIIIPGLTSIFMVLYFFFCVSK